MAHLTGHKRARYVRAMFDRIAPRYDLINRLMTAGQDMRWRRRLLNKAGLPGRGRLLDLGTGTGDVPLAALRAQPGVFSIGADFSEGMLRAGRARAGGSGVRWLSTDALQLPFPASTFDAVTSAFLMRNVIDLERAFGEQQRVLRPGGKVVCLDTTPPGFTLFRTALQFHLHRVIPFLGRLIAGQREAYTYLPESTEGFLPAEGLVECIRAAGFRDVDFRRMMFGTVALHWGTK
tara:strand:- start:153 stop:854 length:702 start_codon:yes stop_codon:yes gene_type:complete